MKTAFTAKAHIDKDEYIGASVVGNYSGDHSVMHAADPATATFDPYNRRTVYRTRCGRKNTEAVGKSPFFKHMYAVRCGRCEQLIEKENA
jgi:hypothetical protein